MLKEERRWVMKMLKWGSLMGLAILFMSSSWSSAHEMVQGTKPVVSYMGIYEPGTPHFVTPIFSGRQTLEGSKPVLLMLGETPRTTLTSAHLRREPWKYRQNPFEETKPVVRMLNQ